MDENKQPKVKILVACHKADPNIRQDDIYMPIQVGKALHPELDLGFQCDNTGDNISEKNGSYCELTALYWAWKNLKDVDYIGLAHYRRYFDFDVSTKNICRIMRNNKAILVDCKYLPHSLMEELAYLTSIEDTYIFLDTIVKSHPEMKSALIEYFYSNNKWTNCNMLISSKETFDEYCQFLFPLMAEVEKRLKLSHYSRMRRVIGYLTEPLLGFWLYYKKYKFKNVGMLQYADGAVSQSLLNRLAKRLRADASFWAVHFMAKKRHELFDEWVLNGLRQDGYEISNNV